MNTFETILKDIFDRGAEQRLDVEAERETVAQAKSGDEAATVALMYAYAPTLRACAARYRIAGERPVTWDNDSPSNLYDRDEMRSLAAMGLLEAVHAFDLDGPHERLAAIVEKHVVKSLTDNMTTTVAVSVPSRSLRRFFSIVRAADGDMLKASAIAPDFEMSRETFAAILRSVRTEYLDAPLTGEEGLEARSDNDARPLWHNGEQFADADDRILCELAFSVADDLETDVCRLAYGFADYEPVPDGEIAHRIGMTRPTVQRKRSSALIKMRAALGA